MNRTGKPEQAAVEAEDALAAALQVKQKFPDAMITYVRKRNERGDRRHPHVDLTAKQPAGNRRLRSPGQEQAGSPEPGARGSRSGT